MPNSTSGLWAIRGQSRMPKQNTMGKRWLLGLALLPSLVGCQDSDSGTQQPQPYQPSVARQWNEVLLEAIRNDYARPTVHARNLFHTSAAMYDTWALFHSAQVMKDNSPNSAVPAPYLAGRQLGIEECGSILPLEDTSDLDLEKAISFAAFELINYRFERSPKAEQTRQTAISLMNELGYQATHQEPANSHGADHDASESLGHQIADCYIAFGLRDGANEASSYSNRYYEPVNPPLAPALPGNPDILDLNHWQPLALETFIDQAGNPIVGGALDFLGPEWGQVQPFALTDAELTVHERDGVNYKVYHDPGYAPHIEDDPLAGKGYNLYQWGFSLVANWASHLDPKDEVMWDISPASIGNLGDLPEDMAYYENFYQADGGDPSQGHAFNPITGEPYAPQWVPRGDYTRVLAEFWADGPDSETPPGHWYVLLNQVTDHPMTDRRFRGQGEPLSPLEWDIKAYFVLGGAMHDSAISAWSIKGWYDYARPITALRAMADLGQSSDPNDMSWHPQGIPLRDGHIEIVRAGEPLAGYDNQHVGKIKMRVWQGPDYVVNPATDTGDVGWILAENWWPYQRPSFVSPPFAGFVSGHSTFSRAAAVVLTEITGSAFFPGGKGEFHIPANEFLVFESGPSVDFTLEWATYQDAADQCSLSRIWGGIHPPQDDLPGRMIGEKIGRQAMVEAINFFTGKGH